MIDETDILNEIERQLHADRGTIHAECLADRLRNILARYDAGFYNKDDPWAGLPSPENE